MLARHLPPVAGVAAALAIGVGVRLADAPLGWAAALVLAGGAVVWRDTVARRSAAVPLGTALLAAGGWLHADASLGRIGRDCRWRLPAGALNVTGVVGEVEGRGRFHLEAPEGLPGGCGGAVRVVGRATAPLATGARVAVRGRWTPAGGAPGDPLRAGIVLASDVRTLEGAAGGVRAARIRARTAMILERRLPREAGLATALVVARRDGLDPAVREAFVRSGTVHLLAISGFHVGVVALLAVGSVRAGGGTRRAAALAASAVALAYAAVLGFPDAATRAALLVTLGAAGRILGRPVHGAGALASAFVVLLIADPSALGRIGFQLSFAGAFGLALLSAPTGAALRTATARAVRACGRALPPRALAEGPLASLLDGVAASAGATALTFPLVAWHFEAVSVVGIPATLVSGPLVAAALPGLLLVVALDAAGLPGAGLPAAGAEALLTAARLGADGWAALPGAVLSVPRPTVVAGGVGLAVGAAVLAGSWGIGRRVRSIAVAAGVAAAVLLQPVVDGAVRDGRVEIHVLDVGQGDAIAIRSPGGRWVLVDTGPDPGDRLLRDLRALGVREVELLVLTHPHLDHVGGAAEVLEAFVVRAVGDPGLPRGDAPYLEVLGAASSGGVPWRLLGRGDRLEIDGMELSVLHPEPPGPPVAGVDDAVDPNDVSVVLRLGWRGFGALLTGDAPAAAEELFGPAAGPIDVLKLGHHGSSTSTAQHLLDQARPAVAVVSLGRFNRFGHPAPAVVTRLEQEGIQLLRTDRHGRISILIDASGRYRVTSARGTAN